MKSFHISDFLSSLLKSNFYQIPVFDDFKNSNGLSKSLCNNLKEKLNHQSNSFMFVGGVVRDYINQTLKEYNNEIKTKILQASPSVYKIVNQEDFLLFLEKQKDIDIATTLPPKEISKMLDSLNISKVAKFATYRIQNGDNQVDITSTRIDTNCDGRHATMEFGCSYFQDSHRRDFTFNALYMNPQGLIFDFHNGIKHLQNKEIHFIGNAKTRIEEDFTRIKRYWNFSRRFEMRNVEIEQAIDYITNNTTKPITMR